MRLGARNGGGWGVALALCAGCASYSTPARQVAESSDAVRGAVESGARRDAAAATNLELAEEELDRARALAEDGRNEAADFMALRARADAELAAELVRRSAAKARAAQAEATARAVEGGATASPLVPSPLPVVR